jgi:hypothetical protein
LTHCRCPNPLECFLRKCNPSAQISRPFNHDDSLSVITIEVVISPDSVDRRQRFQLTLNIQYRIAWFSSCRR